MPPCRLRPGNLDFYTPGCASPFPAAEPAPLYANLLSMERSPQYALGYNEGEHNRLIRQAERFRPLTEAFFRASGLSAGQRVLDLGSGIGDVGFLAASIVGAGGEVVGVERDAPSVARALARAAEAGLANVQFLHADVADVDGLEPFDAVIGRFILQFVPDPVAVLKSTLRLLKPGGIVAFQEVAWRPAQAANSHLPLWSACATATHNAMIELGADTNIGLALHRVFLEAGLCAPQLKIDMQAGTTREHILWPYFLLSSVRERANFGRSLEPLGDLATLAERLITEAQGLRSAVTSIAVVGACSRLPE